MIFNNSQKDISNFSLNLILNHGEIEKVSTFNFLGIILDENIHWKPHIENVACKLAKYCGVLSKLKNFLPLHILRTLYYSIIHPHLNYGLLVWGFQCNRIVKLQKRAIRTITRSKYNAHTSPLLKHMEILSVNDMLHQKALTFHYKYVNKNLPYYFDSFNITTQASLHNYNTRQRDNVRLNRTRIKMTDKCLRNYLPEQLNSVPNIVSSKIYTHSLHGFSSAVKRFILANYSTECTIENCYVCQQ